MFKQSIILVLKGIRYRGTRSFLTVLGIVIAVMLVECIFALGSGVQSAASKMLSMFGSDMIVVMPGKETNPVSGLFGDQRFRERDITTLNTIPGVRFATPVDISAFNTEFNGEKETIMVHAVKWREMRVVFEEMKGLKLVEGTWPINDTESKVILGFVAAHELFKRPVHVGDEIIFGASKRIMVSGILDRTGAQDDDNSAYMSFDNFHMLTDRRGAITAMVKILPEYNIEIIARQIRAELAKQEVVRDFTVLTSKKINQLVGNILGMIEFVLVVIALVSLLVGAVGITNTMYTSVLERTKQIGVLKAIGASSENILSLFLIEAGFIGLFGGIVGLISGILGAYLIGLVAATFGINNLFTFAALDYLGILVILVITFITGMMAGYFPARRASRMEAAEALRYE